MHRVIIQESNGVRNVHPISAKTAAGAKREARQYAGFIDSFIRLEVFCQIDPDGSQGWLEIATLPVTRGTDRWTNHC